METVNSNPSNSSNKNFLTSDNFVFCSYVSNQGSKNCSNILSPDDHLLWLSPRGLEFPHNLIVDLSHPSCQKPQFFKSFGLSCWHAYRSNPSQIRLHISRDGRKYQLW